MDRLDKILAGTGHWSRREVKGLVRAGRVTVNGAVAGSPEQKYDRLGLENLYTTILDVQVPSLTVPVKPGRNLAVIVEVAAMNNRHRRYGYNAAEELARKVDLHADLGSKSASQGT